MSIFLYILAGFAVGFEVGKLASGKKFDWKKALIAGLVAFAVAVAVVVLSN